MLPASAGVDEVARVVAAADDGPQAAVGVDLDPRAARYHRAVRYDIAVEHATPARARRGELDSGTQQLPPITRSIHVDIRYVLWVMDAVDGADHLLTELSVTPSI